MREVKKPAPVAATILIGLAFASLPFALAQVLCPPGSVPRNPAPMPASSGGDCLVKVLDTFRLNEEFTQKVALEKGKSYWFAANGCPKMGTIGIYVVNGRGTVVKEAESYSPSVCYTAEASGEYTIKVKARSLMRSYVSGTIDACFARSRCKD